MCLSKYLPHTGCAVIGAVSQSEGGGPVLAFWKSLCHETMVISTSWLLIQMIDYSHWSRLPSFFCSYLSSPLPTSLLWSWTCCETLIFLEEGPHCGLHPQMLGLAGFSNPQVPWSGHIIVFIYYRIWHPQALPGVLIWCLWGPLSAVFLSFLSGFSVWTIVNPWNGLWSRYVPVSWFTRNVSAFYFFFFFPVLGIKSCLGCVRQELYHWATSTDFF